MCINKERRNNMFIWKVSCAQFSKWINKLPFIYFIVLFYLHFILFSECHLSFSRGFYIFCYWMSSLKIRFTFSTVVETYPIISTCSLAYIDNWWILSGSYSIQQFSGLSKVMGARKQKLHFWSERYRRHNCRKLNKFEFHEETGKWQKQAAKKGSK